MKKRFNLIYIIVGLLVLLIFVFIFIKFSKYHYGYFKRVANLQFNHTDADVIKLSNNQIIILGNDIKQIPSEIYNPATNEVKTFSFKNNLFISQRGIALKDNKILLVNTCDSDLLTCNLNNFYDFKNNISIYDINLQKIVSNYTFKSFSNLIIEDYLCLEDGNVFFILSNHPIKQKSEYYFLVYDVQKNSTNILKKTSDLHRPKGIKISNDEILIFQDNSTVLKYNVKKQDFVPTKSKTSIYNCSYTKIGDKVLILGTSGALNNKNQYNQLYDINQDKITNIPPMHFDRTFALLNSNGKTIYRTIPLNSKQVLIMGGRKHSKWGLGIRGKDIKNAEIYDIDKNAFIPIANSNYTHDSSELIKLDDNILIIGGTTNKIGGVEIYSVKEKGEKYE